MGIEVTAAIATCDKCGATAAMTSLKLPDGWTHARNGNRQSLLCANDSAALEAFFTPKVKEEPKPAVPAVPAVPGAIIPEAATPPTQ